MYENGWIFLDTRAILSLTLFYYAHEATDLINISRISRN